MPLFLLLNKIVFLIDKIHNEVFQLEHFNIYLEL